jgi:hypothetical protein
VDARAAVRLLCLRVASIPDTLGGMHAGLITGISVEGTE